MNKNSENYMLGYSDGAEMFEMTWEKELKIIPREYVFDKWGEDVGYIWNYNHYKPLINWVRENLNWKNIEGQEYSSGYFQALSDRFQYSKSSAILIDDIINKRDEPKEMPETDPEKLKAACEKAVSDMLKAIKELESAGGIKN